MATKASVKSVDSLDLQSLGVQMLLANAYHLHIRPGEDLIQKQGGIHAFMNWPGAVLTDSGGYQVFSLSNINKINDEGVLFRNHLDGGKIFMTPELSIDIQWNLGADILMAFDHCPEGRVSKKEAEDSVRRTFLWLQRSHTAFLELKKSATGKTVLEKFNKEEKQTNFETPPLLFGIVQGALYKDLRKMSLEQVESLDLPGLAVGGMSVGEPKEKMYEMLQYLSSMLPKNKPRYLMGAGTPQDLIYAVDCGFDLFDCVLPSRMARGGVLFTQTGSINIRNHQYKEDSMPISSECACLVCQNYSRSYLRHLFLSKDLLAYRLNTLHNIYFYMDLMKQIRRALEQDRWESFKKKALHQLSSAESFS